MINLTSNIEDSRYLKAVEMFLDRRGYEVYRLEDPSVDFLAVDGDVAALVSVSAKEDSIEGYCPDRADYERAMFEACAYVEAPISFRLDHISIRVASDGDKAIVRHHMDVL